ncbi:hypothetical protein ACN27F_02815 [Solwaraspora sp. WMMB335]|uniref:hypothetical protein n=1 Tax=Solwaraspora sp. WMMB335 TaxID=3404118 RepID=UPI003B944016
MADSWSVHNPGTHEANDMLLAAAAQCGTIIEQLNDVLRNMAVATQNSGIPLWSDLMNQWSRQYQDMILRIERSSVAGQEAHLAYLNGDRQSVHIMR